MTPAGEVLLGKARTALAGVDELERAARSLARPDSVVLKVDYADSGEALLSGRIDVGLTTFPDAWFDVNLIEQTPLFAETRVAVIPRDHELAKHAELETA